MSVFKYIAIEMADPPIAFELLASALSKGYWEAFGVPSTEADEVAM